MGSGLVSCITSTYSYDGFGRRVKKDVDGTVTSYIYDMEDIRFETDGVGAVTAEYTHGPGIDEPLAMRRGGQNYYYHVNGLGSVTALTDSSKAAVQTYTYDSFGQIISQSGSIQNPYTFTGREYDEETGLYYYRARYYDANTGRFISTDPLNLAKVILLKQSSSREVRYFADSVYRFALTYPQVFNEYLYVINNPVNWIDPYGLINWGKVGAGIGLQFFGYGKITIGTYMFSLIPVAIAEGPVGWWTSVELLGYGGIAWSIGGIAWWEGTNLIYEGFAELDKSMDDGGCKK